MRDNFTWENSFPSIQHVQVATLQMWSYPSIWLNGYARGTSFGPRSSLRDFNLEKLLNNPVSHVSKKILSKHVCV